MNQIMKGTMPQNARILPDSYALYLFINHGIINYMPKAKTPIKEDYNLSITVGGETLKGKGETALEALQSITKPTKIVTKGEIILSKGDKKAQMTWQPMKIKKLFYPLNQAVLSKQLTYLLR